MRKRTVIAAFVFTLLLSGIFRMKVFAAEAEISSELQNAPEKESAAELQETQETEMEAEAEEALLTQEDVVYPIGYPGEDGEITDVSLSVKPPVAGVEANTSTPRISCSAYTVADCRGNWQDSKYYATGDPFPFTFEEGKTYYICATLEAREGYSFKKGTQQGDTGIDAYKYDFDGTIVIEGGDAAVEYAGIYDYDGKSYLRLWITVSAVPDSNTVYTVKFFYYDPAGAHQFGSTQTVTGDTKKAAAPASGPQVHGWTFTGKWNRTYDGPPVWNFDSPVSDGETVYAVFRSGKENSNGDGSGDTETGEIEIKEPVAVTGIMMKSSAEVPAGKSVSLGAKVLPANADNQRITFTSSAPKVATVDKDGVVKGIVTGDAVITAVTEDGKKKATCKVHVLFSDVTDKKLANFEAIYSLVDREVIAGFKNGEYFAPNDPCTRAQVVLFMWRAAGKPSPKSTKLTFADAAEIEKLAPQYKQAILWGSEKGFVKGFTSGKNKGKFVPNDPCTRAQIVLFLYRFAGKPAVGSVNVTFTDKATIAALAPDYTKAVNWAFSKKITQGYKVSGGYEFRPNVNCTRGECATFLYRQVK